MGTALSEHLVMGSSLHTFLGTFSQDSRGSSQHFSTPFTLTHSSSVTVVHCFSVTTEHFSSFCVLHCSSEVVEHSLTILVLVTGFLTVSQTCSSQSKHFSSWSR